ncbi:MAG TPA: type II toxin-antitoxin system RelE/ParE family toxin [Dehalococcoidia bacterium]|nr:type II toxin-antitoxin system RelE/ParE family toxin [Dehalococcoidia bacterium]
MQPLWWIGSILRDLRAFPERVRREIGFALYVAQQGEKHPDARPLRGFGGAGVLEVVTNFDGDTYRTIYTVRFPTGIYVLHAFQTKSIRGISTPKRELDLIHARLRQAEAFDRERREDVNR